MKTARFSFYHEILWIF